MFELKVREIISKILGLEIEDIDDEADIIDDLGADSIQVLEIIDALEKEFNVSISDEEVVKNRTVSEVIDFLTVK